MKNHTEDATAISGFLSPTVTGMDSSDKGQIMRSFGVYFHVNMNKLFNSLRPSDTYILR